MKPTNVLLLDLDAGSDLGMAFRGIIESTPDAPIQLLQEAVCPHKGGESRAWDVISRIKPAVVCLISPRRVLDLAKSLFRSSPSQADEPPLIVVSDADAPQEMLEIIQLGAADFITPPLTPTGTLPRLWRFLAPMAAPAHEGLVHRVLERINEKLRGAKPLIGNSPAFLHAIGKIPNIAQCDASILIAGETGTGKEVCARAIHELSPRARHDFIAVNCGAIPIELVENELFGHERGAYTNASSSQAGQIQLAEGGTLFLDEIDSLPLVAQVKLLRFLQEKEFKPLGSTRTRHADVRVITATNVDVERAVHEGRLRKDLYYRLNILPILLPPLRERREDIPLLATHFLQQYAQEYRKRVRGFSADAIQKLILHEWPGNIRELEHVIMRAVVLTDEPTIRCQSVRLDGEGPDASRPESFKHMKARIVERAERTYLMGLLVAHDGNITRAAEAAQKNRRAFFELLRKHNIDARNFKDQK